VALDATTGAIRWRKNLHAPIVARIPSILGSVVVADLGGTSPTLDSSSGAQLGGNISQFAAFGSLVLIVYAVALVWSEYSHGELLILMGSCK
jgi:hypothetical protein